MAAWRAEAAPPPVRRRMRAAVHPDRYCVRAHRYSLWDTAEPVDTVERVQAQPVEQADFVAQAELRRWTDRERTQVCCQAVPVERAERRRWKRGERLRRPAETVAQAELRGRKDRELQQVLPQAETVEQARLRRGKDAARARFRSRPELGE